MYKSIKNAEKTEALGLQKLSHSNLQIQPLRQNQIKKVTKNIPKDRTFKLHLTTYLKIFILLLENKYIYLKILFYLLF